jgi:hypothetical protein
MLSPPGLGAPFIFPICSYNISQHPPARVDVAEFSKILFHNRQALS